MGKWLEFPVATFCKLASKIQFNQGVSNGTLFSAKPLYMCRQVQYLSQSPHGQGHNH